MNDNTYDRKNYIRAKKEEKDAVFEILSEATQDLMNAEKLKAYLDVQAKLFPLSVSNTLLVMHQMPEASWVRSFEDWKQDGISVAKGERGILILDNSIYQKNDGSLGRTASVSRVFDVSQTDAKERVSKMPIARNPEELILRAAPCRTETREELPDEGYGFYDLERDTVFLKKGLPKDQLFYTAARELACRTLMKAGGKSREEVLQDASVAAAILAKRYDMKAPEIDLKKLIETFPGREEKDVRKELTGLKNAAHEIDRAMTGCLQMERAEKENER